MAESRLRHPILWVLFIATTFTGAGFLLSPDPARRSLGLVLLFAPLVVFGALMALYYWKSRREAVAALERP